MTFVITGVSGNTGGAAAELLLAQGHRVRVVVRDRAKAARFADRGAEVAVADVGDVEAMTAALSGAKAAYLLVPPNLGAPSFRAYQRATADALTAAVKRAAVPHVVLLSSIAAQHAAGTGPIAGLHYAEGLLRALPQTRSTFLRASYFLENLGGSLGMLGQGVVPSFFPAGFAFEAVATADIGKVAAQSLVEGAAKTEVIELAGPAKITMTEVAAALTKLTGKPIAVAEAPLDAMVGALTGFGMPTEIAEMYREMTGGMISGHVAFEGGHRMVRGTTGVEAVLGKLLGK